MDKVKIEVVCDRTTDGTAILNINGKEFDFGGNLGLAKSVGDEIRKAIIKARREAVQEAARKAIEHYAGCEGLTHKNCGYLIAEAILALDSEGYIERCNHGVWIADHCYACEQREGKKP